jgi:hypothetical protein
MIPKSGYRFSEKIMLQLSCDLWRDSRETFAPQILAFGRGRYRIAGGRADRKSGDLSVAAGALDRRLSGRVCGHGACKSHQTLLCVD